MLDRHGPHQPPIPSELNNWENVAINSLLTLHNLTPPAQHIIPPLLRIPILIFDINAKGLIDTGAAASLLSSELLFKLRDKNIRKSLNNDNSPIFKTVSGQALRTFGKFEFPITINKDHTFLHYFYVIEALQEDCILGIDFLSHHNVKVNAKNREIHYDHAQNQQMLRTVCPIYSLTIGESQHEIPLTPHCEVTNNLPELSFIRRPFELCNAQDSLDRALAGTKKYISYQKDLITSQPENTKIIIHKPDIEGNRAVLGQINAQNENAVSSTNPIPKPKPVTVAISKIRNSIDRALTNRRAEVSKLRCFEIPYPVPVRKPIVGINKADVENNLPSIDDAPLTGKDYLNLKPFQQFQINNTLSPKPVEEVEFDLKHLDKQQTAVVLDLLTKHGQLFSDKDSELGLAIGVKHYINTGNNAPVSMRQRRTPEALRPQVWKQLRSMLDNNIIRISSSPYAAAIVMTLKKDGSLRLCIDYRWLNKITIKDEKSLTPKRFLIFNLLKNCLITR